ncbi:uncharacterized protein J3D65DRAFT_159399 [Phyllosticta citribraziliensis]|uniref:F-box domain-containing protein n=1 Tax=Phyllosticta citribraziliensis TaxID=989973 RepID=A0ABR1L5X7_9PEZI
MGRPGWTNRWSLSLSRRQELFRLPDEILVLIFESCDIDSLLALRLTCRAFRTLITTYESTIVQAVARSTFPGCKLILRPPQAQDQDQDPDPQTSPYDLKWLTGLIPQFLAAIIVDRHRYCGAPLPMLDGIPAEDEIGDEIRQHVAHGFRILEALSLIAQYVEETPDSKIESKLPAALVSRTPVPRPRFSIKHNRVFRAYRKTTRALSSWRRPQETAERKKRALLQRRQDLTTTLQCHFIQKRLSPDAAAAFDAMWTILRTAFAHHRYFDDGYNSSAGGGVLDWGKPDRRDVFNDNSWANWFVLRAGASFWWRYYWVNRPDTKFDPTQPSAYARRLNAARRRRGGGGPGNSDSKTKTGASGIRAEDGFAALKMVYRERERAQMEIERAGAMEVFATVKYRMKGVDRRRLPSADEYRAMVRSLRGEGAKEPEDVLGWHCSNMALL